MLIMAFFFFASVCSYVDSSHYYFFRKFPLKHYMILSLLVVECRAAPELAKHDSRLLLFGD